MKNILYLISDIDQALSFKWIAKNLKDRYHLTFILVNPKPSQLAIHLQNLNCDCKEYFYRSKKDLIFIWFRILIWFIKNRPEIVHCHLYYADLIGLSISWLLRIKKRIYTRHHSDIHHIYFPESVKIDKLLNRLATDIIVMSSPLKELLIKKEGVQPDKLRFIPHGFDLEYFRNVSTERVEALRVKYRMQKSTYPVIGVIARYVDWKGIQYIIPAFKRILEDYPKAHLILANAKGDYQNVIKDLLKEFQPGSYTEIVFEPDMAALYRIFDVYVHTPIRLHAESFGQTYVEALAAGVPSVFTISGIAQDFIESEKNALITPYQNSEAILDALLKILNNSNQRDKLIANGSNNAQQFTFNRMITKLETVYSN